MRSWLPLSVFLLNGCFLRFVCELETCSCGKQTIAKKLSASDTGSPRELRTTYKCWVRLLPVVQVGGCQFAASHSHLVVNMAGSDYAHLILRQAQSCQGQAPAHTNPRSSLRCVPYSRFQLAVPFIVFSLGVSFFGESDPQNGGFPFRFPLKPPNKATLKQIYPEEQRPFGGGVS